MKPQSRNGAIAYQATLFPGRYLPDVCVDLHMALTGSNDPMTLDQLKDAADLLQVRLDLWYEPAGFTAQFDNAVKALVEVTLKELRTAIQRRTPILSAMEELTLPRIG